MTGVELPALKPCILCEGTGEILERKARQIGYTIAPSEPSDVLEEKLVPCPLCESQKMTVSKCELCGCETLGLETKTVQVKIECCSQCALEWDAVRLAEKTERKRTLRETSYEWADGLHGKKVTVHWDEGTHPVFCDSRSPYHAVGMAYRIQNAASGWGQVKVVLDPSENGRVSLICHYTLHCEVAKRDMFRAPSMGCGNAGCRHLRPSVDGQRFGLFLNDNGDGNWYTEISWGCRKSLDLVTDDVSNKQID